MMGRSLVAIEQPIQQQETCTNYQGDEFVRLRGKQSKLQAKVNKIGDKLLTCRRVIEDHCREELNEIDELNSQILALDGVFQEEEIQDTSRAAMERNRAHRKEVMQETKKKHSSEAKRMYRRIASRWGPDRAKTDRERTAFIDAKFAYNNENLPVLRGIYEKCLNPLPLDDQIRVLERTALERNIKKLKQQVIKLSRSPDAVVMKKMKFNRDLLLGEAKIAVRAALQDVKLELERRKVSQMRTNAWFR